MLTAALGALVSLSSVGAGALGMTVLLILYPGLPTARLVGSDIAHAVPLTLIAGVGALADGFGLCRSARRAAAGVHPGIIVGSVPATRLPDRVLRPLLAGTLAVVGARLAV